jgi:hypothetical protein
MTHDQHPLEGLARLLLHLARKRRKARRATPLVAPPDEPRQLEAIARERARRHNAPALIAPAPPGGDGTPYVVLESDSAAAEREAPGTRRISP